jgi:hypothetical protein
VTHTGTDTEMEECDMENTVDGAHLFFLLFLLHRKPILWLVKPRHRKTLRVLVPENTRAKRASKILSLAIARTGSLADPMSSAASNP